MLCYHADTARAHPLHYCPGIPGCQIRILSETFLTPAPSGIPEHIQHGDQRQIHPQLCELVRAHPVCLLCQLRVEGCSHGKIHRKQVSVQRLMPVGALRGEQHGNAESGIFYHDALEQVVGFLCPFAPKTVFIISPGPGVCPVKPVKHTQPAPALHFLQKFRGRGNLPLPAFIRMESIKALVQLSDFFSGTESPQQVLCPLPGRQTAVPKLLFHVLFLPA